MQVTSLLDNVYFIRNAGPYGKYVKRNINSSRAPILRSYVSTIKM